MTPVGTTFDFEDLANRVIDAAGEVLFGAPKLGKGNPPTGNVAKIQKAKDKAIQRHAIQRVLQHHRHLLKQLDAYRKQIAPKSTAQAEDNKSLNLEHLKTGLETGVLALCPYLIPFRELAQSLPPIRPFGVELSADNIVEGMRIFLRQAEEGRKRFKASIEGAVWNPQSLEELNRGSLFVIEEDALNTLVSSAIATSPAAQKVKNVRIKIDGDVLKIEGEYKTALTWVDFTAQLEFEQKNGKGSGSLKKIKAVGFDLGDLLKSDILGAFSGFGFTPPDSAELDDLSWVKLPGIVRFEITRDKVIVEREAPATGPS